MHVNPKHKGCIKKIWSNTLKLKNFQFRLIEHWSNTNWVKQKLDLKNLEIFNWSKITLNGLKFWKTEFFEKLQKIMQKLLKPRNFMNEMHNNEFKCFSKIGVFNPKLQNKVFNHQKHNFCQPLTISCIKHHRKHNLGWPNQIHTQIHVLSLAKNNLWSVCN